ncbi:putative phosphosugar-binding protein [Dysgonomonas sp. PFB1-18]|uniref:sugar isomerase domain-containing protein n=1 Tax=unclassified Dysgonomonas TaxID=2630389 RepID=UPI0024761B53|nr:MULTISPECIES: sugar isomerase domain-containing protein [unclassified Dysgonomonas]MDH6308899.1 putative phosphosugar-binding protein [Dysgonomonas sp. PF1-14]MDH6338650.1 putative phosphosugar-binding protein [Dysgonomonas sp. PF1-16]MDH6380322.1 putative phosphosugar-binding protein [Dysgonomonas sp. PFB1-18]MDH6397652.1 putative phosphosugar-binding protein [Dysgonomonas sp. PF1-23]
MLALEWLKNARGIMDKIEETQMDNIKAAAKIMADCIEKENWVHTFGCGHATIPIEEMYPRIGGFVGFHPIVELPMTFFTGITGQMGINQFLFLERCQGYGNAIMKQYDFDKNDCIWLFSHTGINNVNIDVALEAKERGMKVIVYGSAAEAKGKTTRHPSGKTLFELADVVVDSCVPVIDASVVLKNHQDKIGPVSTLAFVTLVWMTITTVAEILADRGVKLYIHPSHNVPGDTTAHERLDTCLLEYKRRVSKL